MIDHHVYFLRNKVIVIIIVNVNKMDDIASQLKTASIKLDYLLNLCNESDENNHRQAILKKYIKEITESITDVVEKMEEAHTCIQQCEKSDDIDKAYSEMYDKIRLQVINDKKFIQDISPIMTLWFLQSL